MAHRITVTSIWTAVVAVVVALLASLGFGAKAAPAATATSEAPAPSRCAAAVVRRPARPMGRRSWRAMMRGGSLPPTIKQRIRAEAHGKAPSVRRSTTAAASLAGSSSGAGREELELVA
ncbi:DUF6344 domain-containing protein [Streptomyces flavotricini]|uniref:DUF6344 domain-containing protein n=1 Tax=Streptomyces flavotricini TaxID=66888 RepID=A0ABS8E927_9ACTN|nr:DUF6344 domain-containing protein [Streptomyces flavotricini]MCC0097209.1 DUF6344 domain-containing protein [Streptomyces flavotricini]